MKAKEFLHKKDVAYMNRLSTSLDFDNIVSLMEEYATLRIHAVVGQSEQLPPCKKCGRKWSGSLVITCPLTDCTGYRR
jgi:hypothetical protein